MPNKRFHISEYGIIRCINDYSGDIRNTLEEQYLPQEQFDDLYKFILNSQDSATETEKPFLLFSKGSRRQIKVRNYVGVIETSSKTQLEILPKILFDSSKNEIFETKIIFLKMLRHLRKSPFVNIDNAHLKTKKDFPILEVFIKSFIDEAEKLFLYGVKSDYVLQQENISCIRGKLLVSNNIKFNFSNKTRFYCDYTNYSTDIPINKIIKTTLLYLLNKTSSYSNSASISKILGHLEAVSSSQNITQDLITAKLNFRNFYKYEAILTWSEIFLRNRSFTNFNGETSNLSILFPMEKLFEDYIAYLFNKFARAHKIKLQDKTYFLVESHKGKTKFGLSPDIVLRNEESKNKIVDTKWKILDQFADRKNYNISQADMYQLYAYGKKYSTDTNIPSLVMIYPANPNFTQRLDNFIYEGDLSLAIIPFDFGSNEKVQIESILELE